MFVYGFGRFVRDCQPTEFYAALALVRNLTLCCCIPYRRGLVARVGGR